MKDIGELSYFLGIEVARSPQGITLNQCKYFIELLADSGLLASKLANKPMDTSLTLSKTMGSAFDDISAYRHLIGKLLYQWSTRVDITYFVQQLS